MKTKRVPIKWDMNNMVKVTTDNEYDDYGKAIWRDENGLAYELIYARLAKRYSANPYPYYDNKIGTSR